jgi:translation initiation factor 2 subunit 1
MTRVKSGIPEVGELLLCTVTSVQRNSVFVKFNEYPGKSGIIHISEISPGRIRNIRDYVVEGKVIVCKLLKYYKNTGHFDLSLRRVTPSMHREKIDELKREQLAEKIIEFVAKDLKKDPKKLYDEIYDNVLVDYETIYACFEDVSFEGLDLHKKYGIEKKVADGLTELIKQRIKQQEISIALKADISTPEPKGVEDIKKLLMDLESETLKITYLGSGKYHFVTKAYDYKDAEKVLADAQEKVEDHFSNVRGSHVAFVRQK